MNIPTAVPGTVKEWFNLPLHLKERELPEGPWLHEPHKVQWVDSATGLPCLIVRGGVGNLCGYAGVYPGHPFHKHDYDDVNVDVHGGLTFSDGCQHPTDESQGICHIPEPGTSDDVWWFGFDCAHINDLCPAMLALDRKYGLSTTREPDVYRDVNYVAKEVTSLAAQLSVLGDVSAAVAQL